LDHGEQGKQALGSTEGIGGDWPGKQTQIQSTPNNIMLSDLVPKIKGQEPDYNTYKNGVIPMVDGNSFKAMMGPLKNSATIDLCGCDVGKGGDGKAYLKALAAYLGHSASGYEGEACWWMDKKHFSHHGKQWLYQPDGSHATY
jgi:hypothetical protein